MTSKDVLHAFYVPVLRVKQDIIPRRYTYAWFNATKPGTYRLTAPSTAAPTTRRWASTERRADARWWSSTSPGGYERYLADKAALSSNMEPVELGKMLYEKKGCVACHTIDGSRASARRSRARSAPTVTLADGSKVKVDENYIRESLLYSAGEVAAGLPAVDAVVRGQLKDKEIDGLIAFIKSLK